jgi:hypothetical protein
VAPAPAVSSAATVHAADDVPPDEALFVDAVEVDEGDAADPLQAAISPPTLVPSAASSRRRSSRRRPIVFTISA